MTRATMTSPLRMLACTLAVLVLTGCAGNGVPRLDPSGEHLFVYNPPPPASGYPVAACPPGTVPTPAPAVAAPVAGPPAIVSVPTPPPAPVAVPATNGLQPVPMPQLSGAAPVVVPVAVSPYADAAVTLAPACRAVPIGAEVILVAGVRGGDNYLRTNRRLDWTLAPGSVGQFTNIEGKRFEDYLVADFSRVGVISSTQAIGSTGRVAERVGQGGSVYVARGEGWIGVRSAVEGVTRVTVAAPEVVVPAERVKMATIYWYDAQYSFPEPVVTPPGTKGTLTTTVWKMTSRCPLPGWTVRYELTGGPQAIFVPSSSTAVEVLTDTAGRASVEIVQKDPSPGTSQIRVQLFRPADQSSPRFLVRDGGTAVSWAEGAAAATPSVPVLPGPMTTAPSTVAPPATAAPPRIPPPTSPATVIPPPSGGTGTLPNTSPPAETRPAPAAVSMLEVRVTQRTSAELGANVTFNVEIANRGQTTAHGVEVKDTYDAGLEPQLPHLAAGASIPNPIGLSLGDVAAGDTRQFSITFRVTRSGQLCHRVEAIATDGGRASKDSCIRVEPAAAASPTPSGSGAATPPIMPQTMPLEIHVTPEVATANVGQLVVFTANIRNLTQQPVPGVTVSQQNDATLSVENATEGVKYSGTQCVWNVSAIPPGRTIPVRVQCRCRQAAAKACCRFAVSVPEMRPVDETACIEITAANPPRDGNAAPAPPAAPPSRLAVQVDNRNTVNVGQNQQFLVQISNDGDTAENDIVVTVQLPAGSSFVTQESDPGVPVPQQPGEVRFGQLAELPPAFEEDLSGNGNHVAARPDDFAGHGRQPPSAARGPREHDGGGGAVRRERGERRPERACAVPAGPCVLHIAAGTAQACSGLQLKARSSLNSRQIPLPKIFVSCTMDSMIVVGQGRTTCRASGA